MNIWKGMSVDFCHIWMENIGSAIWRSWGAGLGYLRRLLPWKWKCSRPLHVKNFLIIFIVIVFRQKWHHSCEHSSRDSNNGSLGLLLSAITVHTHIGDNHDTPENEIIVIMTRLRRRWYQRSQDLGQLAPKSYFSTWNISLVVCQMQVIYIDIDIQ